MARPNAINYFDNFYNAELFLRTHGTYSIKITDPLLFFAEAIPKNMERVEIQDINEQYQAEFLEALQTSINQMSIDGIRISHVVAKGRELSEYMSNVLDAEWKRMRGFEVQAVGIASISYDDESKELINMRNKGAMLGDPAIREGYVQGSIARGIEAAGSNEAGSAATFMGLGIGMQAGGAYMGTASQANMQQMQQNQQNQQNQQSPQAPADASQVVAGGQAAPSAANDKWTCANCSHENDGGKFCANCGTARPQRNFCANCGHDLGPTKPKFCPNCGQAQG